MNRYVLFKRGEATDEELAELARTRGVKIIENEVRRLVLIEASPGALADIESALPGWTIGVETDSPRPDLPRARINPTGKCPDEER